MCAHHIDGLVQERRNSIANAPELRLSCNNPSMYTHYPQVELMYLPIYLNQPITVSAIPANGGGALHWQS